MLYRFEVKLGPEWKGASYCPYVHLGAWKDLPAMYTGEGNANCYFTEAGMAKFGTNTLLAIERIHWDYRIIQLTEEEAEARGILARDEWQVAVCPPVPVKQKVEAVKAAQRKEDMGWVAGAAAVIGLGLAIIAKATK